MRYIGEMPRNFKFGSNKIIIKKTREKINSAWVNLNFPFQYSDDVEKLNEAASQRPHSVLVAGLQRESQHLRELQAENRELRNALGDHQNALELIMSKYRQQISQLVTGSQVDVSSIYNQKYTQIIIDQCAKMSKMREVMREAAELDEESTIKDQELIAQLIAENKVKLIDVLEKFSQTRTLALSNKFNRQSGQI